MAYQATPLEVKVPFSFKAGTSLLPAGTYRVTKTGSGCILIQSDKMGVFVPMGAVVVDMDGTGGKSTLKFDRDGDTYVLQGVHSER